MGDQVKQHLGFGDVRRDHLGQGEQALGECSDGVVINELGAGRGDHHRIEHDMTCVMGLQPVRYRADEFRRRYHADLDRGRWNVRVHRVDLCGDMSGVIFCTPVTPIVFCAVIAVIALMPNTLLASMVFRSA